MNSALWHIPATIQPNNFKFKSLSSWSYNVAVGCGHKCLFCYVPEVSTNKMGDKLETMGVTNPDAEWGDYVFPRPWDKSAFMRSLTNAEKLPPKALREDGNRAVMLCTTTDPYQTIVVDAASVDRKTKQWHEQKASDPSVALWEHLGMTMAEYSAWCTKQELSDFQKRLNEQLKTNVRQALELMLACPMNGWLPLNVRILTRSPLAKRDFDLMKQYGNRLLFGMSIPTLNNKLARIYEPHAPAPTQRLATLKAAKAAGLNVYVAVAPVYPDCDAADMEATLRAVKELDPVTIFMEPINIRAENVARIEAHAKSIGETMRTEVFKTTEAWRHYAVEQLRTFERIANDLGIPDNVLHLWPDESLGSNDARRQQGTDTRYSLTLDTYYLWLKKHWNKISAWPK